MATAVSEVPSATGPPGNAPRRPRNRRRPNRDTNQAEIDGQGEDAPQRQNHGRGRGGRGAPARGHPHSLRPMTVAPAANRQNANQATSTNEAGNNPQSGRRKRGGGRGGRGDIQGHTGRTAQPRPPNHGEAANAPRTVQGRRFGGQLTQEPANVLQSDGDSNNLSANAPSFVPGQRSQHQNQKAQSHPAPRKRSASKSTAPDIATRIHEDIENHQYECAICTNEVLSNSKAWSCRTCWTVFHLGCIKKWSSKESSTMAQQQPGQNGDLPPPRQWRCPGCNLPKDILPKNFTCWCEKEVDPRPLAGVPPFSCGQTCAKEHIIPKKCPHPCGLICHAGPCPPCGHMGPTLKCFCGRESATRRCVDTNYESGWSCQKQCGQVMPCGEHICTRPCHEGPCGACEVRLPARCYCGNSEKDILCMDREEAKGSSSSREDWLGTFNCGNSCDRLFDCGVHSCEKGCHPQDKIPSHCPRSPDVVDHCPCGKTSLLEITEEPRKTCEDSIPNCDKPCNKTLACGHICEKACHTGPCQTCLERVPITCRCGRVTTTTVCHQGEESNLMCMRKCKANLNCKRHECGEHCCPGEQKAALRGKKKPRPLASITRPIDNDFEAEHICTRVCGRPLSCGTHTCQELCHAGRCGSCPEAIFHEVSCHCGRTVLQPPLPCGTKPPPCRFECTRAKACGHPPIPHNCHQDEEDCPKCPFLTVRTCQCGKNVLKNQPCFLPEVRCAEECGKKLRCGFHRCKKVCHKTGECEDAGSRCQQKCGKEKSCGHPCTDACHSPSTCKEEKPCESKIFVFCPCMHLKQETRCNTTKTSDGNNKKELKCNDECGRLERNRKLAAALNIDPATHTDDHVPHSTETINLYQSNIQWSQEKEKEFRLFAADEEAKRLRFKPMPANQRAFIHALAEDFGLDSESMDPEPHRHVLIFKTPRFVTAPLKTLAESSRIRQQQRAATTSVAPSSSSFRLTTTKKHASNTLGDPYNGFVLTHPRFALTVEELRTALKPALDSAAPRTSFAISFLPSEEVVLLATSALNHRDLDAYLHTLKPALARIVATQHLGTIELCRLDPSLNVLRRESDSTSEGGGWSQVAAKANAARGPGLFRPEVRPVGKASSFTVLSLASRKKKEAKDVKRRESVVDDWEKAELLEEEKEAELGRSAEEDAGELSGAGSGAELGGEGVEVDAEVEEETKLDDSVAEADTPVEAQNETQEKIESEAAEDERVCSSS